jgi:hypothetical protein
MSTFCRYKLETILFGIAERMLDISNNIGYIKFNGDLHDSVLGSCLLLAKCCEIAIPNLMFC